MFTIQGSLFNAKGAGNHSFIGDGYISRVFDNGDGTVTKQGRSRDGTLGFLIWAKHMQIAGPVPGLPVIHKLALTEQGYVCVMKKYNVLTAAQVEAYSEADIESWAGCNCQEDIDAPEFKDIIWVAKELAALVGDLPISAPYGFMGDLHYENVMYDAELQQYVMTDPSCIKLEDSQLAYFVPKAQGEFMLQ